MKRILKLTLKEPWFTLEKGDEYRIYKWYWIVRLMNNDGTFKEFDEVWYYNGGHFGENWPMHKRKWLGITVKPGHDIVQKHNEPIELNECYFIIHNGPVYERRNYK